MSDQKERVHEVLEKLRQERDELRVQMHLARADAKQEWERIEEKWREVDRNLAPVKQTALHSAKDVITALESLGHEIAEAYRRLREGVR
jgi:hypothetical protein